jgi:transglutaminase-like putative cysteine protease
MITESSNLNEYLISTDVIDYDNKIIIYKCLEIGRNVDSEVDLIKRVYEFVRDEVKHSGDINADKVTCRASEVLHFGHGICCSKSHLLAAMLRYFKVPTGFCYQMLCSDDDKDNKVPHGLNAVYLQDYDKWIRLDARGNKEGVDAQFCIEEEKIAWPANKELGEKDIEIIFAEPNKKVIEVLRKSESRKVLHTYWQSALNDIL